MKDKYEFIRFPAEHYEKLKQYKDYLEKTKGGKWPFWKVILHAMNGNAESVSDTIIKHFKVFRASIETALHMAEFSNKKIEAIMEEIGIFEAFLLQQVSGHLNVDLAKQMLQKLPAMVKNEIEKRKKQAKEEAEKILEASREG